MDMSNELAENPRAPETTAERISAISALIEGQDDEPTSADSGDAGRENPQEQALRGDDSGSSPLDTAEPDPAASLEDATEADAEDGDSQGDERGEDGPVTLSRLADHLGVEPADVYDLEIPIGEGVTTTLGQLKDEFKEYGPAKEYNEQLQRERGDFERQVLATRSELSAIVNAIPPELREHVIAQGRAHQAQWAKDQEQAVLEAVPEWGDADQRATDRAMLIEDGAEYGFSEQEITYTQDARTLRYMRDFAKMKRELQAMRAAAKAQPGQASPPGRSSAQTQTSRKLAQALARGKKDPTIQGKAAVVSELIRSQR